MHGVLVRIDADAELARIRRGAQHADAGAAGRMIDHVRALLDLRAGELAAANGVVPGRACGARHVDDHLGVRRDGLYALGVAAGEAADERDVHAADEADRVTLGGHGREHADEVGAFVFLEHV